MRHETSRHTRATGAAATSGHRAGQGRAYAVDGGASVFRLGEFGASLVAGVRARGGPGAAPEADPGPPLALVSGPEAAARDAAGPRAVAGRVSHRSLDVAPSGRGDPPALRRSLSSGACLETPDRPRLELSETRATGRGTGRAGHRAVEANRLAPDKKTPIAGGPTSCSLMRAASCSSPMSGGPGRRGGRPPRCGTGIATIASRSAVGWPCRPGGVRSRSISTAAPAISRAWTRNLSAPPAAPSPGPRGSALGSRAHPSAPQRPTLPHAPSPAARPLLPCLRARTQPRRICLGSGGRGTGQWRPG